MTDPSIPDKPNIDAGNPQPLDAEGVKAVFRRFLPQIHKAEDRAAELRKRVLNGETQINRIRSMVAQRIPTDMSEADLQDAEGRLEALRLELRYCDAWVVVGLGMALAQALAAILAETGKEEGWQPPPSSMLLISMPGLLSLAIDLHDQSYVRSNQT
jgi:hypothetical protein